MDVCAPWYLGTAPTFYPGPTDMSLNKAGTSVRDFTIFNIVWPAFAVMMLGAKPRCIEWLFEKGSVMMLQKLFISFAFDQFVQAVEFGFA